MKKKHIETLRYPVTRRTQYIIIYIYISYRKISPVARLGGSPKYVLRQKWKNPRITMHANCIHHVRAWERRAFYYNLYSVEFVMLYCTIPSSQVLWLCV